MNKMACIILVIFSFFLSFSNGETLVEKEETVNMPINLVWSITIVGKETDKPNGDGSGKILCKANADNAVRYGFKIANETEFENTTGELAYNFSLIGVKEYNITITTYSDTDEIITVSKVISVAVFDEQQEAGLLWSDEFNTNGGVSKNNWFSEIVSPVNGGWYNFEQQHYTNRRDNAYISNGTLKILALKEEYKAFNSTKNYTSARLNSTFSFTYGRIEVRAKLPEGGGTWPAIWTLGSNINTIGWPACGEMDIMEHVVNTIGGVSAAIHTPSSNGNTVNVGNTNVSDATKEFHVYIVDCPPDKIDFYVDDLLYYTYNPEVKKNDTWPFDKDQFILLNIAMG